MIGDDGVAEKAGARDLAEDWNERAVFEPTRADANAELVEGRTTRGKEWRYMMRTAVVDWFRPYKADE